MLRRHLVALVVLALLPLTGTGLLLGASPAAAKAVRVTAPRAVGARPIGTETVTLTGSIGRTTKRVLKLQRHSGGRWVLSKRGIVGANGRYAFRVPMPGPVASWRVVAPPVRKRHKRWKQRVSKVRTVSRSPETARATVRRSVKVGTRTTVTASFSPVRPGRGAVLQVNEGSGWHNLAVTRQDAAGRASAAYVAGRPGAMAVRAVALAFHGAGQVVGAGSPLAVLRTAPVEVAAHRGASLRNPENTIPAIKNAVRLGADWLELDLHRIAPDTIDNGDGTTTTKQHFVLLHDDTFRRTTDIASVFPARRNDLTGTFTWAEVQQLDAGSWKGSRFAKARVPDLEMTLDAIDEVEQETGRKVRVVLEFKGNQPSVMEDLYQQVKELRPDWIDPAGDQDKAVFMSFAYQSVFQAVRDDHPADGAELAGVMDATSDPSDPWLSQMHVRMDVMSTAIAQRLHADGTKVAVWTVDSPDTILAAATKGADIVTTDDVETARSVLLR